MVVYALLTYISFIFLDISKEKNLKQIVLSKSLFSLAVLSFIADCFITKNFSLLAEQLNKPSIFVNSSKLLLGLYIIIIFFAILTTFFRTKENKNVITIVTVISLLVGFLIYCFCPFYIVCYFSTFAPHVLGLFIVILSLKKLSYEKRKGNNIKTGKFKFVVCIITLILILLYIIGSIFWLILGERITKFLINLK